MLSLNLKMFILAVLLVLGIPSFGASSPSKFAAVFFQIDQPSRTTMKKDGKLVSVVKKDGALSDRELRRATQKKMVLNWEALLKPNAISGIIKKFDKDGDKKLQGSEFDASVRVGVIKISGYKSGGSTKPGQPSSGSSSSSGGTSSRSK